MTTVTGPSGTEASLIDLKSLTKRWVNKAEPSRVPYLIRPFWIDVNIHFPIGQGRSDRRRPSYAIRPILECLIDQDHSHHLCLPQRAVGPGIVEGLDNFA